MTNAFFLPGPRSTWQRTGARPAGFWAGAWHGFLFPLTFLVSVVWPGVRIYETNNRGRLYDFGFWFGTGMFAVGPVNESLPR